MFLLYLQPIHNVHNFVFLQQAVLNVELVMKENIYGFNGNKKMPFLCVTVALQKLVAPARRLLECGISVSGYGERSYKTFESNIDFEVKLVFNLTTIKGDITVCLSSIPLCRSFRMSLYKFHRIVYHVCSSSEKIISKNLITYRNR